MNQDKSLYPEILFHFCGKEAMFGILENTFKVSYARERIIGASQSREIGVPMVSFCDLKLSEVSNHMNKYGHYGIGLTKEWANRNGLNPVLYISAHSPFTDGLIKGLDGIHAHRRKFKGNGDYNELTTDYMNIFNTYRYVKNYEAPLSRKGRKEIKKYRFADEREWRYVPPLDNSSLSHSLHNDLNRQVIPFVPISSIKTEKLKRELNSSISHIGLPFEPEDIRYLIVERDDEISGLITHLELVKGRFSPDTLNRLKSRILTAEQINLDI
jgi:hypothetical protein